MGKIFAPNSDNPMTTGGDVTYGGLNGLPTRLANGASGQVLESQGTTFAPVWATPAASPTIYNMRYYDISGSTLTNSATTWNFNTKTYENGSNGAYASGVYTVPATGVYLVQCRVTTVGIVLATTSAVNITILHGSSTIAFNQLWGNGANESWFAASADTMSASTNDTISVQLSCSVNTGLAANFQSNALSITKIG